MKRFRNAVTGLVLALTASMASAEVVDINTAGAQALAIALQGIGPRKAEAIVAFRDQNGPFAEIWDLTKVPGIGVKLVEANRANLRVEAPAQ